MQARVTSATLRRADVCYARRVDIDAAAPFLHAAAHVAFHVAAMMLISLRCFRRHQLDATP